MEQKTCSGDCLKCTFQQQVYCAAQRSYGIMKNQEAMVARLDNIERRLGAFAAQEGPLINLNENKAQIEVGAAE